MAARPRSALGVVGLATREGLPGVQKAFSISPREAELFVAKCRRALQRGEEIDPATFPKGTVISAQNRAAAVPTVKPPEVDVEQEAQAVAYRVRQMQLSERQRWLGEQLAKEKSMERNIENGYGADWRGPLAFSRRVRELVGVV